MKHVAISTFFACVVLPTTLWSAEQKAALTPEETLRLKLDAAVAVLKNDQLDLEAKTTRITELVSPLFDFDLMGKLALGKPNWQRLSPREQLEYADLFRAHLRKSYQKKLMLYSDERIEYKSVEDKGSGKVEILTALVSSESSIDVLYRLRILNDEWKIYDVKVQGVSLLSSYRAQFDDILSGGTPADLFDALRDQREETK